VQRSGGARRESDLRRRRRDLSRASLEFSAEPFRTPGNQKTADLAILRGLGWFALRSRPLRPGLLSIAHPGRRANEIRELSAAIARSPRGRRGRCGLWRQAGGRISTDGRQDAGSVGKDG